MNVRDLRRHGTFSTQPPTCADQQCSAVVAKAQKKVSKSGTKFWLVMKSAFKLRLENLYRRFEFSWLLPGSIRKLGVWYSRKIESPIQASTIQRRVLVSAFLPASMSVCYRRNLLKIFFSLIPVVWFEITFLIRPFPFNDYFRR